MTSQAFRIRKVAGSDKFCCFFSQKRMFRIRDMFNWSVEVGWDEFWFQGVKNMESEALFYELMSRLPEDEKSTSRNVGSHQAWEIVHRVQSLSTTQSS
ncbi:hypothetical protein DFJ58DRAFT_662022 [Suillus subalutaceus]|uniref:uncharacterized protein n=1 Tax=Suillus subalutaceus TaxID=48586 RepID=UPI001B86B55A|nr:uncharacterized protein DFJ58DRAFT_662022 [Suillus subalutaceus]KAG1850627.1 hypothetical protein DFJ58DRAFT_662022 [Suillus subalutaceus]